MQKLTTLIISLLLIIGLEGMAQCDIDTYTKLSNGWNSNQNALKTYNIEIDQVDGIPINKEYSYVFTSKSVYYFTLYYSVESEKKVKMSLLNNSKLIEKLELVSETENYSQFKFNCPNTGIYYFLFYTDVPAKACATMQLSHEYKNNLNQTSKNCFSESEYKFTEEHHFKFLKNYDLTSSNGESLNKQFSYVFTKNKEYLIQLLSKENTITSTSFKVLDGNKQPLLNIKKRIVNNSIFYDIPISTTGIYYLEFNNKANISECHSGILYYKSVN